MMTGSDDGDHDDGGAGEARAKVGSSDNELHSSQDTAGEARLNSAYGFDFLYADRLTPQLVAETQRKWPDTPGTGWPSWAFENHDAPRALSLP